MPAVERLMGDRLKLTFESSAEASDTSKYFNLGNASNPGGNLPVRSGRPRRSSCSKPVMSPMQEVRMAHACVDVAGCKLVV